MNLIALILMIILMIWLGLIFPPLFIVYAIYIIIALND